MLADTRKRILIIEDDLELTEVLTLLLESHYSVNAAVNGFEGVKIANEQRPDLIITDIKMPTLDGFHAIELIRSVGELRNTPVIVLSGYGGSNEVDRALAAGASEFMSKPFQNEELLEVIERHLQRSEQPLPELQNYLGLSLDPIQRKASYKNLELQFSRIEFALLTLLVSQRGGVVSRDEILQKVWKNEAASTRVMDAHIVSLKNKLKEISAITLVSYYGKGYALEAIKMDN